MPSPSPLPDRPLDSAPANSAPKPAAKSAPQKAMEKLGLTRDIDLALHLPLRYEDETRITPIADMRDGEPAQTEGEVIDCQVKLGSRRQLVVRMVDGAGDELVLRFLNFYPSHQKTLARGQRVRVRGEARGGFFGREMVHPSFKALTGETPLATALTPVYPSAATLPQAYLRKAVASGLKRADLTEVVPPALVPRGLPSLRESLQFLHQPAPTVSLSTLEDHSHPAWQRLKFEELLAQQLSQLQAQRERALQKAPRFEVRPGGLHDRLLAALPFSLTAAQRRVVEEIAGDLSRPAPHSESTSNGISQSPSASGATAPVARAADAATRAPPCTPTGKPTNTPSAIDPAEGTLAPLPTTMPMHRLLQGDVGSGKTVVAALAAMLALTHGWQCALMAPTEILAEQHFRKLVGWLEPLGITVAWLTGSRKGKGRRQMLERVASGEAGLVVGTHAVIQSEVQFARLGLAIVDEQHRFGVAQRLALRSKLDEQAVAQGQAEGDAPSPSQPLEPHLLMMSATPIPRTLAMTVFADLDISTIDELPPGRTPIVTKVFSDSRRDDVVRTIANEVAKGRQVYWVCPLIEESEHLDLQNATAAHQQLVAALPEVQVGLIHGRMPAADKAAVMAQFTAGEMALLVSTTVIEVGVDVPNASLMVIEHAERFGLSQLHQLRGRVGRGSVASVCVLLYTGPLSATGKDRLKAMAETTDGFEIARRDLEIRGPGEFLGARQSGAPLLRFADLGEDMPLVKQARVAAEQMLDNHPTAAKRHLARWRGVNAEYLKA